MTNKELKNIIELIRIRRQEIANSDHPSKYKDEYIRLANAEIDLETVLNSRMHNHTKDIFMPRKEVTK